MRNLIIQFVTGTTAYINQKCPAATSQQRLILNQTTGLVFWDVDNIRYSVNTPKLLDTVVSQTGLNAVTSAAIYSFVQGVKRDITLNIDAYLNLDTQLSLSSSRAVQNKAIYAGIQTALQSSKDYTDSVISDAESSILQKTYLYTDTAVSDACALLISIIPVVDTSLDIDSINTVQNKVIKAGIDKTFSDAKEYALSLVRDILIPDVSDCIRLDRIAYRIILSDSKLPTTSAVKTYVLGHIPSTTVDTQLSNTSTNPVQNKVIKAGIDRALSDAQLYIDQTIQALNIPLITYSVVKSDSAVPTAGAVYDFVWQALADFDPSDSITTLLQLEDTAIFDPSLSQVLVYNGVINKWQNKTLTQPRLAWTVYTT